MSHHFNLDSIQCFKSQKFEGKIIKENIVLPKEIGNFNIEKTNINNNISLFKMEHNIKQNITLDSFNQNVFFINIILDGVYEYKSQSSKKCDLSVSKGKTVNCFVNEEKGVHIRNANNPYKSLGIVVKDDFLKENLFSKLDIIKNNPMNIYKNETTNIKTQICANELFYLRGNDSLKDIYIESKVLEIIYNEFSDILNKNKTLNSSLIKIDEYDKEALNKARDILMNNLQNPPSLKELSRLVRLNEFKLKKGFKDKFNITPYKFLEQCRMQKAKYLLENEDININEVTELLGYKYQSNFSKVFKQHFKINPSEILKNRKYFY